MLESPRSSGIQICTGAGIWLDHKRTLVLELISLVVFLGIDAFQVFNQVYACVEAGILTSLMIVISFNHSSN
jgi:hypothetical protein